MGCGGALLMCSRQRRPADAAWHVQRTQIDTSRGALEACTAGPVVGPREQALPFMALGLAEEGHGRGTCGTAWGGDRVGGERRAAQS